MSTCNCRSKPPLGTCPVCGMSDKGEPEPIHLVTTEPEKKG